MRFITVWRKPENALEWDFYVSESEREAETAFANLDKRGVRDVMTYPLGQMVPALSKPASTEGGRG